MLFYLIVAEFEHLEPIIKRCLRRAGFCEVVNYFLVGECLLDIVVVEVDYSVAVLEGLSAHPVIKYDLFLAGGVNALDLAITADILLDYFLRGVRLSMIFLRELEPKVFLFLFCHLIWLLLILPLILLLLWLLLLLILFLFLMFFLITLLLLRLIFFLLLLLFLIILLLLNLVVDLELSVIFFFRWFLLLLRIPHL